MDIPSSAVPDRAFLPIHSVIGIVDGENAIEANAFLAIANAEVVLGRDVTSRRVVVFYGADRLRKKPKKLTDLRGIAFDLDFDTDELEWLGSMVAHAKGRCDYKRTKKDGKPRATVRPD